MEVTGIDPKNIEYKKIDLIANYLRQGKVVILPTDTCYGMAVNALNEEVITKVYVIKGRNKLKPLSIIIKDLDQAEKYGIIDSRTKIVFNLFLPGKLTIIVKKKENLPKKLTGESQLLGLRIPDCKIIEKVMEKIDFPITATSANIAAGIEPYSVAEILKQYKNRKNKPDLIVDAGILEKNQPSTIIDLSEKKIKLIRSGPIKFRDVVKTIKN